MTYQINVPIKEERCLENTITKFQGSQSSMVSFLWWNLVSLHPIPPLHTHTHTHTQVNIYFFSLSASAIEAISKGNLLRQPVLFIYDEVGTLSKCAHRYPPLLRSTHCTLTVFLSESLQPYCLDYYAIYCSVM